MTGVVMDSNERQLSENERLLFREEMAGAKQLRGPTRRKPSRRLPSSRPRSREADEADVIANLLTDGPDHEDVESGDELSYRQPGVQLATFRRLRRGQYRVQAELDLHGLFVATAREAVARFLQEAQQRDYRCLRIIHGKGLRSGNRGPVVKTKLAHWLRQRSEVLAYTSARPVDGGTGAVYVLLRKA